MICQRWSFHIFARGWLINKLKGERAPRFQGAQLQFASLLNGQRKRDTCQKMSARRLATPKGSRTLPGVLTVADASLAMDAMATRVGEEDGPISKRDAAMLEILYASGARVSELCGLDLEDIDYARQTIRVLGKGNKERTIPIGNPAMRALELLVNGWTRLFGRCKIGARCISRSARKEN
jgi:integrase/recombinase XerC